MQRYVDEFSGRHGVRELDTAGPDAIGCCRDGWKAANVQGIGGRVRPPRHCGTTVSEAGEAGETTTIEPWFKLYRLGVLCPCLVRDSFFHHSDQQAEQRIQRAAAAGRGERQKLLSIYNQLLDLEERRVRLQRALYKCYLADPESQMLPLPDPRKILLVLIRRWASLVLVSEFCCIAPLLS